MKFFYYIRRFGGIPIMEKKLLIVGFSLLPFIQLLVYLVPIKYYIPFIKSGPKFVAPNEKKAAATKMAGKCIKRMALVIPWHCSCLVKSIIMKFLLNSLGVKSSLIFSVRKSQDISLKAHACLKIEDEHYFLKKNGFHEVLILN